MLTFGTPKALLPLALLALTLLTAPFCGAELSTNFLADIQPVPPFPDLSNAAKKLGIPLEGIMAVTNVNTLSPGDSVTALFTLHEKGNRRTQWLVYFQIMPDAPATHHHPEKPLVLYSCTGNKFEYSQSYAGLHIRSLGPYVDSESFWGNPVAKDKSASVSVNQSYLALGLDRGAAAVCRWTLAEKQTGDTNFNFWFSPKPLDSQRISTNQQAAAPLHVTASEERAVAAWSPVLDSYFESVGQTPNLISIFWRVVSLPSMWSIMRHGIVANIETDVHSVAPLTLPSDWNMPGDAAVYAIPMHMTLNKWPCLDSTLIVTAPRPPLLTCGGIIGFLAQNPKDSENYLTLRIISAHCAGK